MSSSEILVSVICMTYNHENYIRQALEGFVNQKTDFKFEVIVHDDCSTDNTVNIIKEYEEKYPKIIKPVYEKENQYSKGVSITRNILLPKSRGKYIALCEGDDYWIDNNKLQLQVDYISTHKDCSLVANKSLFLYPDGETKKNPGEQMLEKETDIDFKTLCSNLSAFTTASMLYKKEFYYKHNEFLDSVVGYDYVYKLLLASDGYVHILKDTMSVYRVNAPGSWSMRIQSDKRKDIEHINLSIDILEKLNKYLDYKYDIPIKKNVTKRKYKITELMGNIKELKKGEFKDIYKSKNIKYKIRLYVIKYFPIYFEIKNKYKK